MLEGNLVLALEGNLIELGPGEGVRIAPGAAHTFSNPSDQPTRFLVTLVPGGFEGYFVEAADLAGAGEWPPTPATMEDMNRRFDVIVAGS